MMEIDLLSFGIAKEIVGASSVQIQLDGGSTVGDLKAVLRTKFPKLEELDHYLIAKNEEYAEDEEIIDERDEIVLIPPVSGG